MSEITWFKTVQVQKGRRLASEQAVVARLREIRDNKKSKYHKHYLAGNIHVIRNDLRGAGKYDIVYLVPINPEGVNSTCGECLEEFFTLDEDYLCPSCREQTET